MRIYSNRSINCDVPNSLSGQKVSRVSQESPQTVSEEGSSTSAADPLVSSTRTQNVEGLDDWQSSFPATFDEAPQGTND